MQTKEEITKKIIDVLEKVGIVDENTPKSSVTEKTHLINDLGLDSLDLVEVVMGCETEFGISIPDDQAAGIKTIGEMTDQIFLCIAESTDA